jgi:hypothetical protein
MTYILIWLFAFIIIGALWYVFDRVFGVIVYRWWYGMTHREPLPLNVTRGFIFNQPASVKFFWAMVICFIQSVFSVTSGEQRFPVQLLAFFLEVPMAMLGFYFGPTFFRLWREKDELLEQVDKIESGELSIRAKLKEARTAATGTIRDALGGHESKAQEERPVVTPKTEAPLDPEQLMKGYLKRDGPEGDER